MKKTLITILVVLIIIVIGIVAFFFIINKNENEELQTIQLNEVTRSVFYAPQYVAISNGIVQYLAVSLLNNSLIKDIEGSL